MKFKLIFEISKSLLFARWKQTLVAAIGVTFSITMFISLLGFMNGLNDLLDGIILNRTPHIRLYNEVKPTDIQPIQRKKKSAKGHDFIHSVKPKNEFLKIKNYTPIHASLLKDKRVLGVAPKVTAQVFYNIGSVDIPGVINGVDVEAENKLFLFQDYVPVGNTEALKNTPNSIILGIGVAQKMLVNVGDLIQITTSKGAVFQLKVVGLFQSGLQDIDKMQSYCSLRTTQKIIGEANDYVTDLQVKLTNIELAPQIAKEYAAIYQCEAVDIQTANAQFETGSDVRSLISYAVGITLLIVAGFGIYNILNMMIYEKMDSIAILKATGFSGRDVNFIFITIALTIGVFGGALGLIFGFLVSLLIDNLPFVTAALPTVKTFPVNYSPVYYIIGGIFSIITTYFAGYFPSQKASKIDPVDIIRGK